MEAGPPPSPDMYGPLSPPISGSDTSAEGAYHSRNSSTSSSRANSLVHRNPLRYNPTPSPSGSSGRRSRGRSFGDSDEDMGVNIAESIAYTRKEATRRQRIEAEQRRRDELRDGYARLKDVLPVSNQKSSKVSLLERATNHIVQLEKLNQQLQKKIQGLNAEIARLQNLNEKISLNNANSPSPGVSMGVDSRPLSPPPETSNLSQLTSVSGQEPPREDSPHRPMVTSDPALASRPSSHLLFLHSSHDLSNVFHRHLTVFFYGLGVMGGGVFPSSWRESGLL
ncbi:hypothetical protein EI94DRAFT_1565138 [Lactarius quietus]|nr:hypothetical protein EI94DRAFT_1565138 [Lactarius quietus]